MVPARGRRLTRPCSQWGRGGPGAASREVEWAATDIPKGPRLFKARLIYFHWTPEVITVSSSSGGEPLREPPHMVVNRDGKIAALGQEAETAAQAPGMQLMRFPDVAAAWQQQRLAATALSFYWMSVEHRGRSDWMALVAGLWPPLQSYLVVHPAEGAERGLGEPQARWLRGAFRRAKPQRTFVWTGDRLDPALRLTDAGRGGKWMAGAPRCPI